jgi:SAM-dependent methyltransferase
MSKPVRLLLVKGRRETGATARENVDASTVYGRSTMTDYALAQEGAEQQERARLALLEQMFDPHTVRQLDAIGVGEGWHCLDVGAGGGSATRLLAERVGATGSVLAVDLDTRLLEPLAGDRVEVRRHDLLSDPLPEGAFDLVHARNLLMHLPGRLRALRLLLAAVRPGGWLAVCEPDFTGQSVMPRRTSWHRAWSGFLDATVASGWDPRYGGRLIGDLESLDVVELRADEIVHRTPGGSVPALLFAGTLERLKARMLSLGVTVDDVAAAQEMLADPRTTYRAPTVTIAWARRQG